MGLQKLTYTLFLVLITANNLQISTADTTIKTTDFYDYIEIVEKLSTAASKLRVLNAVWAEIRCEYQNELKAIESLHWTIHNVWTQNLSAINAAQQQEIDEFDQKVRQVIINRNGHYLAQIINISTKPLNYAADNFVTNILIKFNYDPKVTDKIFENAIDQLYGLRRPLELAEFLRFYEIVGNPTNNGFLFKAQLYLYSKFIGRNDIDDSYILYVANYMSNVKSENLTELSNNDERRLNNAIKLLPSSVQNLFFTTKICLLNAGNSEYLYEYNGNALDAQRKYIFTWRPSNLVGTNGPFNIELTQWNNTINGILRNVLHQHYLYLDNVANNGIYAWHLNAHLPITSRWSLALNDNKLRFYQGDLYLCSAGVYDNNRRYVKGLRQAGLNVVNNVCEWYINNCP